MYGSEDPSRPDHFIPTDKVPAFSDNAFGIYIVHTPPRGKEPVNLLPRLQAAQGQSFIAPGGEHGQHGQHAQGQHHCDQDQRGRAGSDGNLLMFHGLTSPGR